MLGVSINEMRIFIMMLCIVAIAIYIYGRYENFKR